MIPLQQFVKAVFVLDVKRGDQKAIVLTHLNDDDVLFVIQQHVYPIIVFYRLPPYEQIAALIVFYEAAYPAYSFTPAQIRIAVAGMKIVLACDMEEGIFLIVHDGHPPYIHGLL
jgi:hypothetical protein